MLASPAPTAVLWGPELIQLYNDAYIQVARDRHPAILGRPALENWSDVHDVLDPLLRSILDGGPPAVTQEHTVLLQRADGSGTEERVFQTTFSGIRDESGAVGGIFHPLRETTEAVRTQAALRESETKYRTLFHSIDQGFCILHVLFDDQDRPIDYRFTETNPAFVRQGGFDPLGRRMSDIAPIEPGWIATYGRVATTGEPERFTSEAASFGRTYDVFAFRIGQPEERRVAVLFADITASKQAAEDRERLLAEVAAERERLRTLLLQMPTPVALLQGPEHRFTLVNDAFKRVSGGGRDVTGLTLAEAFPELAGSGLFELYDQVYASGEPWFGLKTLVRYDRDGTGVQDTWLDLRLEPSRDADGQVVDIINFAVDVTDQVRARREVERLLEAEQVIRGEAEAANRAKTEFLAVMSHELRTPLNAIGGYTELLEMGVHGPVTEGQRNALVRIQQSQRHLLGLINQVLNYARLESGNVRYDIRDVPVQEVLEMVCGLLEPQARARDLVLWAEECPPRLAVRADVEKLRQILLNLLGNAIKFTNAGGRVEVTCRDEGERVALSVRDTGIGIPADKLRTIFDPFVQVRSDLTRTAEGTGLGLAISRDLARGMRGDLTVESTAGEGSTFTLFLPSAAGLAT